MNVSCFRIGEPFRYLLIGGPSPSGLGPLVRLETIASFKRHAGGQRGLYRLLRARRIQSVYAVRYDRAAARLLAFDRDCLKRLHLVVHPAVPLGLIASNGGTSDLGRDMRSLFAYKPDADEAAADVARLLEQVRTAIG